MLAIVPLACGDDVSVGTAVDGGRLDAPPGDAAAPPDAADVAVVQKGARVLGVALALDDTDFPSASQTARDAGVQTASVTFAWDDIERPFDAGAADAGAADAAAPPPTTLFNPGLHIMNLVLADRRLEATLAIEAFDVGGSRAPADLAGRALDDPAVTARYEALLDYVFSQIRDTPITALLVAKSADVWLEAEPKRAPALAAFIGRVAAHARVLRPGLQVGFTVDDVGRMSAQSALLTPAWAGSDFVGIDYVPAAAVARGTSPRATVPADFDRMAKTAPPGKPIVVTEAGYPTAAAAGPAASEDNQAVFVTEIFRAWDRNPERFSAVVFREWADATPAEASARALRRGRSDAPFLALLQSLGIRARDGRAKPGFEVLRREASARAW